MRRNLLAFGRSLVDGGTERALSLIKGLGWLISSVSKSCFSFRFFHSIKSRIRSLHSLLCI